MRNLIFLFVLLTLSSCSLFSRSIKIECDKNGKVYRNWWELEVENCEVKEPQFEINNKINI